MKYLKTYEFNYAYDEDYFWLIESKNDAYFLASLRHIHLSEGEIKHFLEIHDHVVKNFYNTKFFITNRTGYMPYDKGFDWYIKSRYKFKGEIKPTKEEIELAELEINTKKYNL